MCVLSLTSSNNVDTLVVGKGLEGEEGTEALVKGNLARVVAKVSVQGLVSLRSWLGDWDVFEGHCVYKSDVKRKSGEKKGRGCVVSVQERKEVNKCKES